MDIAALSIGLNQMKLSQEAGVSVLKMAMDKGQEQMNDVLQMVDGNVKIMEQSVTPHIGGNIDIKL